jgi:hypothetical protein
VSAATIMLLILPVSASAATQADASAGKGVLGTTREYVTHFYPRWFTYSQAQPAPVDRLTMPRRITPLYHTVVAINDDTFYAAAFVDIAGSCSSASSTPVRYESRRRARSDLRRP